ncbi:MAG: NAD+ diphosphatase [Paracoccaceae bacterium]|jgi:NAD+ diphosphatase
MKIAEQVTFGTSGLDRAAEKRGDVAALAQMKSATDVRILPLWHGKPMVQGGDAVSLATVAADHPMLSYAGEDWTFLGLSDGAPWFAADISDWEPVNVDLSGLGQFHDPSEQVWPGSPEGTRFAELRAQMSVITRREAELAATAKAVLGWHQSHAFCSRCGAKSSLSMAGWQRNCNACGGKHFPRTDPVVIMLITHGNKVLMGRSPGWPEGMFSLLAGFVEPGETLEAAVRREVFEEAGISVGAVSYLSSQPWPFPASLMFGCRGEAQDDEITIDPVEIEDAMWVTREDMAAAFAGQNPAIKPARKGSIAHFLLENWLADRLD